MLTIMGLPRVRFTVGRMMVGVAIIAILFECALIYNLMLVYRSFVAFHDGQLAVDGPMAKAWADYRRKGLKSDPPDIAEKAAARADYHRQMRRSTNGLHVDPGDRCHPIHQSPLIHRISMRTPEAHRLVYNLRGQSS